VATWGAFGQANNIAHNAQLNFVHTFTPNFLLELKAGYTLINNSSQPLNYGSNPNQAFGQPNVNINQSTTGLAPINVVAATALGGGGRYTPLQDLDNTYQYLGNLTYTHGAHTIKTGLSVIRRQGTNVQSSASLGYWVVADLPSLVQGNFTSVLRNYTLFNPHYRSWEPSGYVQDDWRAAKNLTLNLGVRYEVYTPYVEANNHISNFDPVAGKIIVAGVGGTSRSAGVEQFYGGIAPRVGFAYTAAKDFVVRGGFGISFFPSDYTSSASLKNSPDVSIFGTCTPANCGSGITKLANGVPLPTTPDYTNPVGSIPAAKDPNYRPAYLEQYNLTLEKAYGPNVLTASYVGSVGRHLYQDIPDLNAPPPTPTSAAINGSFNSFRPYYSKLPNITTIQQIRSGGSSSYNAIQLAFERRFTKGLSLGTNYTYAHILDDATAPSNQGNEGFGSVPSITNIRDYGNSTLDLRNRFAFTTNYAIPYGENAKGIKGVFVKGWQTNVLLVWSSGVPFSVLNATNVSNTNPGSSNTDRPNQLGNANLTGGNIAHFFDTTQFVKEASGVVGNAQRNSIYGPHYRHLDLSLFKTFPIHERVNLQFRAEGFNLTNTTNFGQPNNSLGTGTFGTVTTLSNNYNPRLVQLVARVQF
jgi:hypothetical protein